MVVDTKFHRVVVNKMTWSWCPNDFLVDVSIRAQMFTTPCKIGQIVQSTASVPFNSMEFELYRIECVEKARNGTIVVIMLIVVRRDVKT